MPDETAAQIARKLYQKVLDAYSDQTITVATAAKSWQIFKQKMIEAGIISTNQGYRFIKDLETNETDNQNQ